MSVDTLQTKQITMRKKSHFEGRCRCHLLFPSGLLELTIHYLDLKFRARFTFVWLELVTQVGFTLIQS